MNDLPNSGVCCKPVFRAFAETLIENHVRMDTKATATKSVTLPIVDANGPDQKSGKAG